MADRSTKEQLNAVLHRLTGHHFVSGAPGEWRRRDEQTIKRLQGELERARKRAAAAEKDSRRQADRPRSQARANEVEQVAATQPKPAARTRAGDPFPADYDEDVRETIRAVREYTMTGNDKLFALIAATKYVTRHKIPGQIVECGVWRGGSMQAVARTLSRLGDQSRELYLFDTFEGMTPPTDLDVRVDGRTAASLMESSDRDANIWAIATLDEVKAGLAAVSYPADKIHYVQGKVEETIPGELPERIALLRLDTDWYESTAHELAHAYDRLSPGGVLIIDDYGSFAGARRATDEFLERTAEPLLMLRAGHGRVAVKPLT